MTASMKQAHTPEHLFLLEHLPQQTQPAQTKTYSPAGPAHNTQIFPEQDWQQARRHTIHETAARTSLVNGWVTNLGASLTTRRP
jgi:hypothetical protein